MSVEIEALKILAQEKKLPLERLINAIENSDAVIKASEELPIELLDYLSKSEKPVLDYLNYLYPHELHQVDADIKVYEILKGL